MDSNTYASIERHILIFYPKWFGSGKKNVFFFHYLPLVICILWLTIITVIFSVSLFVRVLYSRYRIQRRIDWRNYKKLTLQLLLISVLCIALQLPPMILYAAYSAGLHWDGRLKCCVVA
jgi:hypothetical protein